MMDLQSTEEISSIDLLIYEESASDLLYAKCGISISFSSLIYNRSVI